MLSKENTFLSPQQKTCLWERMHVGIQFHGRFLEGHPINTSQGFSQMWAGPTGAVISQQASCRQALTALQSWRCPSDRKLKLLTAQRRLWNSRRQEAASDCWGESVLSTRSSWPLESLKTIEEAKLQQKVEKHNIIMGCFNSFPSKSQAAHKAEGPTQFLRPDAIATVVLRNPCWGSTVLMKMLQLKWKEVSSKGRPPRSRTMETVLEWGRGGIYASVTIINWRWMNKQVIIAQGYFTAAIPGIMTLSNWGIQEVSPPTYQGGQKGCSLQWGGGTTPFC